VNRMFLLGKCWAKCLNACNVLSMFPPKSRYPHPQWEAGKDSCWKERQEQRALRPYDGTARAVEEDGEG
jgi:hypothetical protein